MNCFPLTVDIKLFTVPQLIVKKMNQNPQAYHLVTALLNAWEAEGYTLGVDSQLLLRELLQKLPEDIDLKDLKTKLTPVLANTREQQELFYELFDKKLLETEDFYKTNPSTSVPSPKLPPPSVLKHFMKKWGYKLIAAATILTLIWVIKKAIDKQPEKASAPFYIDVIVDLNSEKEQNICIDDADYINGYHVFDSVEIHLDTTIFEKVTSINKLTSDSAISHTQLRTEIDTNGKACIYFKGLSVGEDSVQYRVCIKGADSCTTARYIFHVVKNDKTAEDSREIKTLDFKEFNHTPNISSLIPTEKMRFGWKFGYWDWIKTFALLLFIALILLLTKWLKKRQDLILKDVKGNAKPPYAWTIQVEGAEKVTMNDAFYSASNQLRRRSDSEFQRLNMNKTVLATIRQGGRVSFQYRYQTQANEYLILIDRQSAANHRAQTFNLLYKAFAQNEVLVERFYYDGDIRLCWNETHKRGISLKDLQHKYPEYRLIVIGSGMSLLSPTNGKLAKWATVFDHWRTRALMTTRPPAEWDIREAQLATKFRILPATLKGLSDVVETLEAIEPKDYRLWKKVKDESAEPLRLPETLTADELMGILKAEYTRYANGKADDSLVQWIAACAVYPSLHWDLTLALGASIGAIQNTAENLVSLDNLFVINRLTWFTDGKIPEPSRKILLKWLADNYPSVLERTRKELQRILANSQPPTDSIAYEDHRLQMVVNDLYLNPNSKQRKELEAELEKLLALDAEKDFLVAEYLNRPRSPLDFVVPDNLKKFVSVENEKRVPKLRSWLWQAPLFLVFMLGLFCFNPNSKICDGKEALYNNAYYCIKTPQDSLIFYEQVLCDTLEMATDVRLVALYDKLIQSYRDSSSSFEQRGFPKEYSQQLITGFEQQKDSIKLYFNQNGLPENSSFADYILNESFKLIRSHSLDSASFYRNVPIAYWNAAVKHFNKGNRDSACYYFNKLDRWAWRDSVLTPDEVAIIGKTCFSDFQKPSVPKPQSFRDKDFEPFQVRKQYGYRNPRTRVEVIPPQYQNAQPFSEGLAAVKIGGKWGFIDYLGNEVIPPQYDGVALGFKQGLALVQVGKEQFFVDKRGKRILNNSVRDTILINTPTQNRINVQSSN